MVQGQGAKVRVRSAEDGAPPSSGHSALCCPWLLVSAMPPTPRPHASEPQSQQESPFRRKRAGKPGLREAPLKRSPAAAVEGKRPHPLRAHQAFRSRGVYGSRTGRQKPGLKSCPGSHVCACTGWQRGVGSWWKRVLMRRRQCQGRLVCEVPWKHVSYRRNSPCGASISLCRRGC